jgi:hypothetical protein
MSSRPSTDSPDIPDDTSTDISNTPKPPTHLFRTIKSLSSTTYLCLPRTLPEPLSPTTYEFPPSIAAFKSLRNTRMHQQIWLLEHTPAEALIWSVMHNGASELQQAHVDLLPSLVVVKMGPQVRNECDILLKLHSERQDASLYVGETVMRAQFTSQADSTWMCVTPVFGPSVNEFGEACGGVPGWFLAHVFLGLLGAAAFVQEEGVTHGHISSRNVVLNLYPTYLHHRYRGYPDVQLVDFGGAGPLGEEDGDAKKVLEVVEEVVSMWSDCAPFLVMMQGDVVSDEPILLVLQDVRRLLQSDAPLTIAGIRARLEPKLIDIRHTGPEHIPRNLVKLLHSDLATGVEFEHALREPTTIRFGNKHEQFVRIMAGEPVNMGSGGHAGMKTSRIMVIRFTSRKTGFLRVIGEDITAEMAIDVDGKDETDVDGDGEYETADEIW